MNCRNFKLKRVILLVVQPSTYSTLGVYESPSLASVVCYLVPFALLAVLSPVSPHSVKGFLPHTPLILGSSLPKYRAELEPPLLALQSSGMAFSNTMWTTAILSASHWYKLASTSFKKCYRTFSIKIASKLTLLLSLRRCVGCT